MVNGMIWSHLKVKELACTRAAVASQKKCFRALPQNGLLEAMNQEYMLVGRHDPGSQALADALY